MTTSIQNALSRAEAHAPFLRLQMRKYPDVVARIESGDFSDTRPVISEQEPRAKALRVARGKQALSLAIGDLAGALSLEEVTKRLSDFADLALHLCIEEAIRSYAPDAEPRGFAAIALGKHGSGELNYSSDIDPILIFDPLTLPCRSRDEPAEAAVRIGRKIVELLQSRDEHGHVFRIDLRLRPSPEVTPIALPIEAAISYYESQALPWERAAFIRSRVAAGDIAVGHSFLTAIQPFIWRRGLDFGAIRELRSISARIRSHHARGQLLGPGFDIKRGHGGIRDCEFFAQIHQLIFGGREPALRAPATCDALRALADAGRIDPADAETLIAAYRLYRTIEHRLQMVDDRQTHALPTHADELENVARLHGLPSGGALIALLAPAVATVARISDALDGEDSNALPTDPEALAVRLAGMGFSEADHAARRIEHWRSGTIRALRSPAALQALELVLPRLAEALGKSHDPTRAINRFSDMVERLPSAINLFRLLEAQPGLMALVTTIMVHAPTLADALARRADLLDRLIDATAFEKPADVETLAREMRVAGDLEDQLDHARRVVAEHRFALGVQLLEGAHDPLDIAGGYARVAEAAIQVIADATISRFESRHGKVEGAELVLLALGRMGGSELTHASDIDLIYLFTGDFTAESDGEKPLGAVHYFNRLAQHVTTGLSAPTGAGALYEIDTRLRPSGNDGLLAVSLDGFAKYQAEQAWTWEHMALCRARVVYGSAQARSATQAIIDATLNAPRDTQKLVADAAKMRAEMAAHKPPKGPLDIKLCAGGLVDLEFVTHVTQLRTHAGLSAQLSTAIGDLAAAGRLPKSLGEAHRILTRLLVTVRLVAPDLAVPDAATCALIARACGKADWTALMAALKDVTTDVAHAWANVSQNRC
jgi:[glutamine synthetase] adenylyltransferase / [glutamine synthetase]-adenylyl-L-tyrosine phosphorylase